jgi:voltage-gated potassium channel
MPLKLPVESPAEIAWRFGRAFLLLALLHAAGTIGFRVLGGPQYTWLDCLYMTFITIATIGYGEVIDLSNNPAGRVLAMVIGFLGIANTWYIMSLMVAYLVEGKINEAIGRRRMEKQIHKLKDHYIVCGIGRVGRNVANELVATQRTYVAIDEAAQSIESHLEHHPDAMHVDGDATDDDVLLKAHIETATGVFAVTGDDSKNLLITITAKQLNPAVRVVARCHEVRNIEKIRKAGADAIVSPDFTGGLRIASAMIRPHVVSFLDEMLKSEGLLRVEQIVVPSGFPETRLGELKLGGRDYILVALHEEGKWVFNPDDSHRVRSGTALIVMATPEGRKAVEGLLGWV